MTVTLRAGTWNIHEGVPSSGNDRNWRADLVAVIAEADLDVLALQEVPFGQDGRSAILEMITGETKLRYASGFPLSPSSFSSRDRSGVALVSRAPHNVSDRAWLPNPNLRSKRRGRSWVSWDKGILIIELTLAGSPLWAGSVHCYPFHNFGRKAEEREFTPIWSALADAINRIPGNRMIVAGDFNTERLDLLTNLLGRRRLVPAIGSAATHHGLAVDDILHDSSLIRKSCAVTPTLSDHAFCQAEFILGEDVR
jgi:endonuclease/exonuclease/phosphatase family metal-dependent hydrolase